MKHRLLLSLLMTLLVTLPTAPVRASHQPLGADDAGPAPTATEKDDEDAPYSLSAAYPNPFRSRTRFDLRVEKTQHVEVEVYNILGQRVRALYEGTLRAGDKRTFTLKARDLPSGLYLYRVQGETFTAARRVTLVR